MFSRFINLLATDICFFLFKKCICMDVCRSRGNRSSVRLSVLVSCTAVVSLLTFLHLPPKTDWRLMFASEVETTNSTNGEASTFISLATSLKTSKASYTAKESSTKSTSAEAIGQSTPSFMSDKPNRVRILSYTASAAHSK
jgi:hypothetical protein